MKLLHCSDLHLGRRLHGAPLLEDQRAVLNQILVLAQTEAVDAVLLAGDLYDKPVPPVEAVGLLDWFLTELSRQRQSRFPRAAGLCRVSAGDQPRLSGPGLRGRSAAGAAGGPVWPRGFLFAALCQAGPRPPGLP